MVCILYIIIYIYKPREAIINQLYKHSIVIPENKPLSYPSPIDSSPTSSHWIYSSTPARSHPHVAADGRTCRIAMGWNIFTGNCMVNTKDTTIIYHFRGDSLLFFWVNLGSSIFSHQ